MGKIYLNARFLTQEITGVQRFAIETSRELVKLNSEITFLAPKNTIHPKLAKELNVKEIGRFSGHLWEQVDLPFFLKKEGNPLLLNLANTAPLSVKNMMVVLHDVAFARHPEWFSRPFSVWYNYLIPRVAEQSRMVFTVSEFSKGEISSFWPTVHPVVVGNGLSPIFKKEEKRIESKEKLIVAFAGNNERKNAGRAIVAFKQIPDPDARLVLIGKDSRSFSGESRSELNDPRIETIEDVSDQKLKQLYLKATMLVYPSSYEGFGLPPLEALACGCPSVLSNIPVFNEIYRNAALIIDENSTEGLKNGIEKLLNDNKLSQNLLDNGQSLLEKFTFKLVANNINKYLIQNS